MQKAFTYYILNSAGNVGGVYTIPTEKEADRNQ